MLSQDVLIGPFVCSAVIKELAGETKSPTSWEGNIMQLIGEALTLPFNARFRKVDKGPDLPEMPDSLLSSLSHDQHVGYRYYRMLKTGWLHNDAF